MVDGVRAKASTSLQQGGYDSLISCLTERATLISSGIPGLANGRHSAVYEGRGAHRDVYRVDENYILKLEADKSVRINHSNALEAQSLIATKDLPQTVDLYYHGSVVIEYRGIRNSTTVVHTLTVDGLLQGSGGLTYDRLMHKYMAMPMTPRMANFFLSAYRDLSVMVIDGVSQNIAYSDMHTANVGTRANPENHVPGNPIASVVVDAEGVQRTQWSRSVFNSGGDDMLGDFELQCQMARHDSWHFLGELLNKYLSRFFKEQGADDLTTVRSRLIDRFQLMWTSFSVHQQELANRARSQSSASSSKHYAPLIDPAPPAKNIAATRQTQYPDAPWHSNSPPPPPPPPPGSPPVKAPPSKHYANISATAPPPPPPPIKPSSILSSTSGQSFVPPQPLASPPAKASVPRVREVSIEPSSASSYRAPPRPSSAPQDAAAPMAKASSPFDRIEENDSVRHYQPSLPAETAAPMAKSSSPFDRIEDTDPWRHYKRTLPAENMEEHYASRLGTIVQQELQVQRTSKYRGVGRFQQDRAGRMSWEDRHAVNVWDRTPEMTREQCDDIGRLCSLMYHALHNVLNRCPRNSRGNLQRRVELESEFLKYGMVLRVYRYVSQFTYTDRDWCNPAAVYAAVQLEFGILAGEGDRRLAIHGFQFIDQYERDFLARAVARAFISHGVLYQPDSIR
jgi:hypothetical protein